MIAVLKDIKWTINYMISIIMYAIIVILILIGIILAAYFIDFKIRDSRIEAPLYNAYVIVSGSMEPIIKIKDAVLVRRCEEKDIKVGDVVTYRSMDEAFYGILITHRVVNIIEENGEKIYITKGDNNETIDRSPIKFNQIQGKVAMRIPKIGYLKYFLTENYGWIMIVVIPSIVIIVLDVLKIFKKGKNDNNQNNGNNDNNMKKHNNYKNNNFSEKQVNYYE